MSAVPLQQASNYVHDMVETVKDTARENPDWMRIGVGSTLLAGALLLITGKHKAGLVVTAAGATLAMLEHRELVSEWWEKLPGHLQNAQHMLDQAQSTIEDLSAKRDSIMNLIGKR